ncbi:GAF domain-containing protein [Lentzea xinjiangensis]|uniref:GAF domain-containing protein n=1 Tax=Lentzea xinjiangensis TaxID=402600 RepID=A0A1H9RII3_9PSEU|nr:GAF and ANTAR domain-containing protein [Lentzea xinjiangensis]SER72345.1 GAF domain-containing protein [Lentzea xinjiangensis]
MPASKHLDPLLPVVLDEITTALERLSEALSREDDLRQLMHQVCEQVVRAVPGLDEATVTLLDDGKPFTAASTSDLVARLDGVQYDLADGPCLEASRTGRVARATIDEVEERWPVLGAECRAAGMVSFLSAPLTVDDKHSGAINGYSKQDHGFRELDAPLLALYTTAVETALRSHSMYLRAFRLAGQLRAALTTRAVIDQAKGVLMAVHGITADEAFRMLAEQSQRENVKLHALAERFIATIIGQPAPEQNGSGQDA